MLQSELSRMLFTDLPHPSQALAEAVLGGSVVEIYNVYVLSKPTKALGYVGCFKWIVKSVWL